jgi:hypothetical protein
MRQPLVVVVAIAVLLAGGCGGGSASSPSDEVADTIDSYLAALADNEGQKLCDLLTMRVPPNLSK